MRLNKSKPMSGRANQVGQSEKEGESAAHGWQTDFVASKHFVDH